MKKKALILDVDGTLYYHIPIKIIMGLKLISYYIIHLNKIKEFLLILKYRQKREKIINRKFN